MFNANIDLFGICRRANNRGCFLYRKILLMLSSTQTFRIDCIPLILCLQYLVFLVAAAVIGRSISNKKDGLKNCLNRQLYSASWWTLCVLWWKIIVCLLRFALHAAQSRKLSTRDSGAFFMPVLFTGLTRGWCNNSKLFSGPCLLLLL